MIFNEYGEIVTIESKYRSIDEWLQESYKIEEYLYSLNEGKIAAGIEKAIRWLIDGFMQLADWIGNLRFQKSINILKKHKAEAIEKLSRTYNRKLEDYYCDLDVIQKYASICKNPSEYINDNHDTLWSKMIDASRDFSSFDELASVALLT